MPIEPNSKAHLFNTSQQSADTDLLASDVTPSESITAWVVSFQPENSTSLKLIETEGAAVENSTLNDGSTVTSGVRHVETVPVRENSTYNFQLTSAESIDVLNVDEVKLLPF